MKAFFLVIEDLNGANWILDYSQVLMISDMIGSRFLALLYCCIHSQLKLTIVPTMDQLSKFYRTLDKWFLDLGNETYNYIKQIETICVANYLKRFDKLRSSKEYFSKLMAENEGDPRSQHYLRELDSLITELTKHPLEIMEFFGCFRHFGHPTVDELTGMESLRDNSTLPIEVDPKQLAKVSGAFNRMFILEFIAKKKRWPKCSLREGCSSSSMGNLMVEKPISISEFDTAVTLTDWSYIDFHQEFIFDDFPDYTSLQSDTAISPYLESWYSVYSRDLIRVPHPPPSEEFRRVLVEVLRRTEINCKKIRDYP